MSNEQNTTKKGWFQKGNRKLTAFIVGTVIALGTGFGVQAFFANSKGYRHMERGQDFNHGREGGIFEDLSDAEIEKFIDEILSVNSAGDITPALTAALITHPPGWHQQRRKGIGGSDAIKIMSGEWTALWEEKTGRSDAKDLSDILPVQMGSWTEPLNRHWFEKQTGMTIDLSETAGLVHPKYSFLRANLDGRVGLGIFEAKHVSPFAKPKEVRDKYYAQCQHNMAVSGTFICYLSIFLGTLKWEMFEIVKDPEFQETLLKREIEFWHFVETDTAPPVTEPSRMIPPALDSMREVDMTGNNAWAAAAVDYSENQQAAANFKCADKTLKDLIEDDVKRAFGHGVEINRAKGGSLRIKRETTK